MHIKCGSCGTRYSLDADRIKGDSVTIKCPSCHKSMVVQKPQKSTDPVTTHTVGPGPNQKKARKGKKLLNGNGTGSDLDLTIEDLAAFQDLDLSLLEDSGVFSVDLPVKDHDSLDLEDRVSYDFSDVDVSALDEDSYSQGKVVTVEFEPPPGSFSAAQSVALSTRTPQAVIYYTMDGSEPGEESEAYLDPIDVVETTTIKAIAIKSGWDPSDLVEAEYQITGKAGLVTFLPEPGEFALETKVELTCATPNSKIYYTIDGKEPTPKSQVFEKPITIPEDSEITIKARAYKKGWEPGDVESGTYKVTGHVKAITFSVEPGVYTSGIEVALSCQTPKADIHYTVDGSEPTAKSPKYGKPVPIKATTTVKARAFLKGWTPSDVLTGTFTITGKVKTPVVSPEPGVYPKPQHVTITCPDKEAAILFTTDGTDPNENSPVFSQKLEISAPTVIKAMAVIPGWEPSDGIIAEYEITGQAAEPTCQPKPGSYDNPIEVVLESSTPGAAIHFTLDGSDPTEKSSNFGSPIKLAESATLKARAFKPGWEPSRTLEAEYKIVQAVSGPVISPAAGRFKDGQTVSIKCDTPEAEIYYTLDGDEPTEKKLKYGKPFDVNESSIVKARAFRKGWTPSEIVTAEFTITRIVAAPVASPAGGQFDKTQSVSLSCGTSDAAIYFTSDGSDPTEKSPKYEKPIDIAESGALKAKAFKEGWEPSDVVTAEFTITRTVATPAMSPSGGRFDKTQSVSLSCGTPDAAVYYTLDNSDPTEKSSKYEKPIDIAETSTLKVRAFHKGWEPSEIATAEFTITRTVATPAMSPSGGRFDKTQSVSLSCGTSDAAIYFTSDGSDPTEKSPKYEKPIDIAESGALKAKAFKEGWEPSDVVTAEFTITRTVATPAMSPSGGRFDKTQSVSLSCSTSDAAIYFTLDGSDPTEKSSKYEKPIDIAESGALRAKAFKEGWEPSGIAAAEFTITRTVATPAMSPSGGRFDKTQSVSLSCGTSDAAVYYTLDNSDPTEKSSKYEKPVEIADTSTLKARAFHKGWEPSDVVTAEFTITRTVATPAMSPSGGRFDKTQSVSLSCGTSDAAVYYTLDNSDPTEKSSKYEKPVEIADTSTLKARAFHKGWEPSDVVTAEFTITRTVATPAMSPSGGRFDKNQSVSLSCGTSDAAVYYTLDNSDPTEKSSKYEKPIEIAESGTLKAKAFKEGWEPSDIATAEFEITRSVAEPVISPAGGAFADTQIIDISCSTEDAAIHYTTDGTEPEEKSTWYSGPIEISESVVLKARGFKKGWTPSQVVQSEFTITRTVAAPVASPSGGQFDQAQTVSLSCDTPEATLYYTLDNSDPTEASLKYAEPIEVAGSTTLKARAFKDEWEPSDIVTADFTISRAAATPVASPSGGQFDQTQTVSLSCDTPDAAIYYTLDNSDPTESSLKYTEPIEIAESTTLKARAFKDEWEPSDIVTADFTISRAVAAPVASPSGGQFDQAQTVSLSCDTPEATLYYTLDNSDPTEASSKYGETIEVAESTTLKARAFKDEWEPSDIVTADFTISRAVATPVASPSGGQFDQTQMVSLSCDTPDAAIYYTLDNSDPTESSLKYTEPIEIAESTTLKARAFKDQWEPSGIAIADFTISRTVATPVASPSGGQFDQTQTVSLSCDTPDAAIYYTLDNSDPTENSSKYEGSIEIAESTTLKARAFKDQWEPSGIAIADFTISRTVATPVASPSGGQFDQTQTVSLSCDTPDAAIYYTLDNSDPTENSSKYEGSIEIAESTTLKVRAFNDGWEPSEIVTAEYAITRKTEAPEFNPPPAEYAESVQVSISSPAPNAVIHYTIDGTDPDAGAPVYDDSIVVLETTTIKAFAVVEGWEPSDIVVGEFWIPEEELAHEEAQPPEDAFEEKPAAPVPTEESQEAPEETAESEEAPEETAESEEGPEETAESEEGPEETVESEEGPEETVEPEEAEEKELPPWAKPATPRDPGRIVPFPKIALDGTAVETFVGKDGPEYGYEPLDVEGPPPSEPTPADEPEELQDVEEPAVVEEPEQEDVEVFEEEVAEAAEEPAPVEEDVVDLTSYEDEEESEEDSAFDEEIKEPDEDSVALGAYQSEQADDMGDIEVEPLPDDESGFVPFDSIEPPPSEPELPPPPPEEPEVLQVSAEPDLGAPSVEELEAERRAEEEARAAREAEKEAERLAKEAEKEAERAAKEAQRQAKEAEKEAERAAKEAEKEAQRQAKEAEKAEKEAEKEAKRQAKEQARQLKPERETNWRMIGIIAVVLVLVAVGVGLVMVLPSHLAKSEAKAAWQGYQVLKALDDSVKANVPYEKYGLPVTKARVEIDKLKDNPAYTQLDEIMTLYEVAGDLWDAKEFREETAMVDALKKVCPLAENLANAKDSPAQKDAVQAKIGCAPGYYSGVFAEAEKPSTEPIKPDPRLVHVEAVLKMLWAHASDKLETFAKLNKPE
jgi:predicted Zn finger-like uncharacterized protein